MDLLCRALERVGLEVQETTETRISCSCPWLEHRVDLVWIRTWWPDGETLEDAAISIRYGDAEFGRCDVAERLRRPHPRPLAMMLIDDLADTCGRITRKHHSASRG